MKKLLLGLAFVLVLASIAYVSAVQMSKQISEYGTMSGDFVKAGYFNFVEGWNLVYGLPHPDWLSGGDITASNIKAIYGFNPVTQKYVRFFPNPDRDELNDNNLRIDTMIATSAFWVYSDKEGRAEYETLQSAPLSEKRLISGWNFIGIGQDMAGKTLNEIKGNCNIERAYAWDTGTQEWDDDLVKSSWKFQKDSIVEPQRGIAIKVTSDCKLGSSVMSPPKIPTDDLTKVSCADSDGGKNYYVRGFINVTRNGLSEVYNDICGLNINGVDFPNKLEEKYCDNGVYADIRFDCPNGCDINKGMCK